jgi:hypothetical protein
MRSIVRRYTRFVAITVCCLLSAAIPVPASAQTIVGRISGTVTDQQGAVIPGATVTITNEATDVKRTLTADDSGFYVATNLPIGNYTVTAEHAGFKMGQKTGNALIADGRLSVDFELEPGAVSERVTVTAAAETINKTSGELSRTIDQEQVHDLALNARNYQNLETLIPGAPVTQANFDQLAQTTSLNTGQPINGTRGNSNLLLVDNGFNLDSGSNGSQINNVSIDFVKEVDIKTSNFSAEYGRNAGASINVVTRSGGNQYHGSAYEYIRNDAFDANNFFNNNKGRFTGDPTAKAPDTIVSPSDPRVGHLKAPNPALRFNDFGWTFGGPIKKDKLFFFVGEEYKRIRQSVTKSATIPTVAERNGIFPTFTVPASKITADGKAFADVYNVMQSIALTYTDTPTPNNALFAQPNPFNWREDLARVDYIINEHHSLFGRYLHDDYNLIDPYGTFINSALPTIPTNRLRPGYGIELSHTWLISPTLINEAKINTDWNGQRIPPVGVNWERETFGFVFPKIFPNVGRFPNGIPNTSFNGGAGYAGWAGPNASLLAPTADIAPADNLSWIKGSHTLKMGVLVVRNRKDQNGRSNYTGTVAFNVNRPGSTGDPFADALEGNFQSYSESSADPVGHFRFTQVEAYAMDDWRVNSKFSVELGLRYSRQTPIYTQANNIANFVPSLYNPANAPVILPNGNINPASPGVKGNGLVIPGLPPSDQTGRVPLTPAILSAMIEGPRGLYPSSNFFQPRVSFAWSPHEKTAIRGGFGIFSERSEGNLIFSEANNFPWVNSVSFTNGNIANIAGGTASALSVLATQIAINPNLKPSYVMNYSLSVQRELPSNVLLEVAFQGSEGRRLLRQPDINQADLAAFAAARAANASFNQNSLRPFLGYGSILMNLSDAISHYDALQVYLTKRKGNLTTAVSYTWSKSLDNANGQADVTEELSNNRYNYGPSTFDYRHIFSASYTYRIPFFRDRKGIGRAALAGWDFSGIIHLQSGLPLTVIGNTIEGNRRADILVSADAANSGPRTPQQWFNTAAFVSAPNNRRGNSGIGVIAGPNYQDFDTSLRKQFVVTESTRIVFQAQFFNVFNRTNFNTPNMTIGGGFGTITGAGPPRQLQFGLRVEF